MPYVLVQQATDNYHQWKQTFDSAAEMRAEAGCVSALVLQGSADPNELVILFEFEDLDRARRYIQSPQLEQAWERAAVRPGTQIRLLTRPDSA
ncbi:putative quinol monooxygenase [Arthrobacter castelli]|uniref:putative quinol monooxygenase n=1 Tax=Arthrobacter castelli TaxID=271431 RepID=UPI0004134E14|nr:antibiotic biosynthesis monooxygenase [Arthrobacter castelli]